MFTILRALQALQKMLLLLFSIQCAIDLGITCFYSAIRHFKIQVSLSVLYFHVFLWKCFSYLIIHPFTFIHYASRVIIAYDLQGIAF